MGQASMRKWLRRAIGATADQLEARGSAVAADDPTMRPGELLNLAHAMRLKHREHRRIVRGEWRRWTMNTLGPIDQDTFTVAMGVP